MMRDTNATPTENVCFSTQVLRASVRAFTGQNQGALEESGLAKSG